LLSVAFAQFLSVLINIYFLSLPATNVGSLSRKLGLFTQNPDHISLIEQITQAFESNWFF